MEILFYHLTETKVEDALPALLERSLERNWRVAVQTVDDERCGRLDAHLWTFRADSFLPHGMDSDPFSDQQPILLTSGPDNANGATVRFVIDGAAPPELEGYDRVVFMFDGHDETQLGDARLQWKKLKGEGHTLSYWQQNRDGRWEKKA
ncbi:DNA polymerase III subunit chi [Rhizobium sp.]